MRLGSDEERDLRPRSELRDLERAQPRNDAAVLRNGLGAHNHHVDLSQEAHDMRDSRLVDLRDRDSLRSEVLHDGIALLGARVIPHVHDAELALAELLGRTLQQARDSARRAVRQHALALGYEAPASLGDAVARSYGAAGEQAAVLEQVLADALEAGPVLRLQRRHEVLLEKIGAGGQGHGVGDGGLEAVRVRFYGVERFVDGRGGHGVEQRDEGFDGRDGLREVRVRSEDAVVRGDDAVDALDVCGK